MRFSITRLAATLVLLSWAALVPAMDEVTDPYWEYRDEVGRGEFSYDDSQDIPWIENETEVLALPTEDNLWQVNMDSLPPGFKLFVDRSRITVGPGDYVVRMWLWLRNGDGVEKGTFEGYRCETGEYKVYAYANPRREPAVRIDKRAKWRPAKTGSRKTYRHELLNDYLCGIRGTRSARDIQQVMTGPYEREYFLSQ